MSIKIYSGFKLKKNTDLFDLHEQIKRDVRAPLLDSYVKTAYEYALKGYDNIPFSNEPNSQVSLRSKAIKQVEDEFFKNSRDARVYLYRDPENVEDIYAYFVGDNLGSKLFSKLDVIESEFNYWDNTDRPSNVKAKAWKDRLKVWERLLDMSRGVGNQGLIIQFFVDYDYYEAALRADLSKLKISNKKRAYDLAEQVYTTRYLARASDQDKQKNFFAVFNEAGRKFSTLPEKDALIADALTYLKPLKDM
jgi:hypothetical protein